VASRQTHEGLAANRTSGRRGVGFGLRTALNGLAEQFLDIVRDLDLQMAEVLSAGLREALERMLQRARRASGQHGQRFGCGDGS
jgi:hypothetical protein